MEEQEGVLFGKRDAACGGDLSHFLLPSIYQVFTELSPHAWWCTGDQGNEPV